MDNKVETYVGLTATTFKSRLATHKRSFIERQYNQTALSIYIALDKSGYNHEG